MAETSNKVVHIATRRARAVAPNGLKIWACSCGALSFFLYSDGSVQCTDCRTYSRKITCSPPTKTAD